HTLSLHDALPISSTPTCPDSNALKLSSVICGRYCQRSLLYQGLWQNRVCTRCDTTALLPDGSCDWVCTQRNFYGTYVPVCVPSGFSLFVGLSCLIGSRCRVSLFFTLSW